MTREINGRITMRVSDDGTRCAAECPYHTSDGVCDNGGLFEGDSRVLDIARGPRGKALGFARHPECIAAEQAAASVPSCEGIAEDIERLEWHIRKNGDWLGDDIVESIERIISILVTSPPVDAPHLDGGARALDASEARAWTRGDRVRSNFSGGTGTLLDPPDSDGEAFVRWDDRHVHAGGGVYAPASDLVRIPTELEALRDARVQGMREGFDMAHGFTSPEGMRDAERALAEAIEAVRKGKR